MCEWEMQFLSRSEIGFYDFPWFLTGLQKQFGISPVHVPILGQLQVKNKPVTILRDTLRNDTCTQHRRTDLHKVLWSHRKEKNLFSSRKHVRSAPIRCSDSCPLLSTWNTSGMHHFVSPSTGGTQENWCESSVEGLKTAGGLERMT